MGAVPSSSKGSGCRLLCWAVILAMVMVTVLMPITMSSDSEQIRTHLTKGMGNALAYITTSASSNDYDYEDSNSDEEASNVPPREEEGEEKVEEAKSPPKPTKRFSPPPPAGVDAEKVAKKYFLSPPPPPPPAPPSQFNKSVSFIDALKTCKDMECVKSAHYQPKKEAKFNFPHFLIIGFQKAATTSLHVHLGKHPQALRPLHKEPEFFTNDCNNDPPKGCPEEASIKYINETLKLPDFIESKGRIAPYESSTHVVRRGDIMAKKMHDLVPWAKIIISLREPISRAASMLIHMKDVYNEGCLSEENLGYCLHARSQIRGLKDGSTSYFEALSHWFTHWPESQIHIVQYEELTNERTEYKVMRGIKNFIEVDPELPQGGLTVINDRRFRIQPKGWPMSKKQYLKLIDLVKPDVDKTLDLMEAHGKLRYREGWMKKWEKVWEDNLNTCDKDGNCIINLS